MSRIGAVTNMKHNVEFKNLQPDQKIRRLITELIDKLEKRAKRFPPKRSFCG